MIEHKGYTDETARAAWNRGAAFWLDFVRSGADYYRTEVHGPALLKACDSVTGLHVLDLGCGEGYFSRALSRAGAQVIGIDIADELLNAAKAQEREEKLGTEYRLLSATDLPRYWDAGSFDLVTGCMSVQDMSDPPRALQGARWVLPEGARMVFSVPHPGTDTTYREWERDERGMKISLRIDRYFETGPSICNWNMERLKGHWATPYWRRTLSEWCDMIAASNFCIKRLHEPRPSAEQVTVRPNLEDCFRVPYFLIFDLVAVS